MNDAEAAARAIVHIFATGNLEAVPSLVADEYVDHQGLDGIEIRGRGGFCRVVRAVQQGRVQVSIEDLVAGDDKAAVRLRWVAVDDSGRRVIRETLDLLRFSDDRLVEHWGAQIAGRES
jgi:predicted SnoaL-like aldol condensation-catalyzing enzyme